tara:strand:- start:241 stop:528 length:288 start_codon:yes stop_codon:yes gene_type:complete
MSTQTVAEVLSAANDSVELINDINTNGSDSIYVIEGETQEQINDKVQRNVDHLKIILSYEPTDEYADIPDVVGSSEDKSSYTSAITTGEAYIAAN